jgi:hypothetical protein
VAEDKRITTLVEKTVDFDKDSINSLPSRRLIASTPLCMDSATNAIFMSDSSGPRGTAQTA